MNDEDEWIDLEADCPNCDDGTLWRQVGNGAAYCNSCDCTVTARAVIGDESWPCSYSSPQRTHFRITTKWQEFS